jgi:hypothetical protein
MYDASNRKSIRAAEKAAKRLEADRVEFLQAALGTRQGRTWFYHFLADCGAFVIAPSFDPHQDYFQLGQRNVGLRIFAEIKSHCPDQYILMEREEYARIAALESNLDRAAPAEQSGSPDSGRDLEGRTDDAEPDYFEPEPAE